MRDTSKKIVIPTKGKSSVATVQVEINRGYGSSLYGYVGYQWSKVAIYKGDMNVLVNDASKNHNLFKPHRKMKVFILAYHIKIQNILTRYMMDVLRLLVTAVLLLKKIPSYTPQ